MIDSDNDIAVALAAARNFTQLGAGCRRVAERLGFPHFLFGFRIPLSLTQPCQVVLSGYPKAWRERYDDCEYLQCDPAVLRCQQSVLPFGWDELALAAPRAQQLFADAARHGLRHGFSVPVHGAHGEGSMFSFARETALPPRAGGREELFARAQGFTLQLHERMVALLNEGAIPAPERRPLTPRERECLQHAADGGTTAMIGRGLRISEHTVNFHLTNAEAKLGARSRRHAVVRAVALGQIAPACYPRQLRQSQKVVEFSAF
jgi:DNA-binding CsgD family transcriptional regulator